jgi:hypothetical protein
VVCTVQKRLFRPIRNYLLQNVGLMLPLLLLLLLLLLLMMLIPFSPSTPPIQDEVQALSSMSTRREIGNANNTASTKIKPNIIIHSVTRRLTFESASPRKLEASLCEKSEAGIVPGFRYEPAEDCEARGERLEKHATRHTLQPRKGLT